MSDHPTAPALKRVTRRHPLQRLSSPSLGISAAVHLLGLASFANQFKFLVDEPNHINDSYGWHFQFLTIIGLALSTACFTVGLLADTTASPTLFRLKSLLSASALPLSTLISVLYWGLRAIDPALVVPPDMELPLIYDLGFHAFPTVILLFDLLFLSPPWTLKFTPAIMLSTGIAFAYWFWIELCFSHNGFYPYPLFEILNTAQRVMLFVGCALAMAGMTALLNWAYARINGVEVVERSS